MTPDSQLPWMVRILPVPARPFALLARFDRPIGWWLLYWPCAWGVLLAGEIRRDWPLLPWLLMGAMAMRGAGCVYNDIADRDLDAQVERTRSRPLPSGSASLKAAWIWLIFLSLIGLIVLLQLNRTAQIAALASLAPVAAYPFMKRITWWPQAWLGIVFSWGALVGWLAVDPVIRLNMALLYLGSICWVIGYDTIYALQDREDDALIGVRSSALRMGGKVRLGVGLFYSAAVLLWVAALFLQSGWSAVALIPAALHLGWQVASLKVDDGGDALSKFRSNRLAGLLVAMACFGAGLG
jgi:4-hydroxybenzoate polyprenyltransferase